MSMRTADAIIVGGGLVGVATAIAVAKAGLQTIHLAPAGPPDRRTSALMMPSVDFLVAAGLIDDPANVGHPLTQIRIIDATQRLIRAPETLFDANEAGLAAFGWNFANSRLLERFHSVAATLGKLDIRDMGATAFAADGSGGTLTLADGNTISAPLIVGADGKSSLIRSAAGFPVHENQFEQAALVCDLDLGRAIGGASIEFHYPNGPFTLVPAGDKRANLVWIDERSVLEAARSQGPEALAKIFADKSQRLFGTILPVTPSHVFPLSTLSVARPGKQGVVLVGEAAHAFPPIGAQGLNLGLRDVADLATVLGSADRSQPDWAGRVSQRYADLRAADLARTGTMVDALFRSLLADMLPAQGLRAGGLWALRLLPGLRKQAFGIGMGNR
ncbi:2-octaprenyl-6-methoxyphenyl hydroxylase [Devosia yakushimensis]|uniref:2-octaprenyl-6-methoxyphenyl hydroxylase n=1 Tax=Devosia yakushimensis TaxID=470028 RepID=A0ABQ5UCE3_9HYPH|nr:FAD-dependent monooxygenase [Devosia yakushimensis]GLQ09765.1 2-octaprenyl-6-methoxyphenyl hydroxylase [Devosia yakushimensis]